MRTLSAAAYDGRVIFHTRHVSLAAYELMETLTAAAKEANAVAMEKYAGMMDTLISLLAVTPEIEFHFDGNENPALLDLQEFWDGFSKAIKKGSYVKAMELAIEWRKNTMQDMANKWVECVNAAQSPVREPEKLPFNQLTPDEQAEALTPESPLPAGG